MNEIIIQDKQEITADLFNDFILWIDRAAKTERTYIINLRQFAAWMRYAGITQPNRADIIAFRDYLTTEHDAIQLDGNSWKYRTDKSGNRIKQICKPNTVTQYLRSVKQFFKWTASEGYYPDIAANVHAPKLKHDHHRKEALKASEVQTIENSILQGAADKLNQAEQAAKDTANRIQRADEQSKRLYALYLLAVTAGLRTIELSRTNVQDFKTRDGQAYIYIWGKGHSEPDTRKPLAAEVATAIQDYLQSRTDSYSGNSPLFAATGNRYGGKRLTPTTISTMLKKAMQAAGFDSDTLTAHSLRHTAGTNTMQVTNDLYSTQKYMRHANPATTEIYIHTDQEQTEANIAQKLYNHFHGIQDSVQDDINELLSIAKHLTRDEIQSVLTFARALKNSKK